MYYICIHQTIEHVYTRYVLYLYPSDNLGNNKFGLNLENWDLTKVLNSTVFFIIFLFLTEKFITHFFKTNSN